MIGQAPVHPNGHTTCAVGSRARGVDLRAALDRPAASGTPGTTRTKEFS